MHGFGGKAKFAASGPRYDPSFFVFSFKLSVMFLFLIEEIAIDLFVLVKPSNVFWVVIRVWAFGSAVESVLFWGGIVLVPLRV